MAKRFTDTTKWDHPWFHGLSLKMKIVWGFLCDRCDGVGVWRANFPLLSFFVGDGVTAEEFDAEFGSRIVWLGEDKIWIPSFITFQYKNLTNRNRAHIGIMRKVIDMADGLPLAGEAAELVTRFKAILNEPTQERVNRPSTEGQQTLQEKEEYKEKEIGKGKEEGGVGETKLPASEVRREAERIYKAHYPHKVGKSKGIEKAVRDCRCPEDVAALEKAVIRFGEHHKAKGTEPKYIPHFSTFMGAWRDWLEPETGSAVGPPQAGSLLERMKQKFGDADDTGKIHKTG